MTLAKIGSRLIVVKGHSYRWAVAGRRSGNLRIVVQDAQYPGQRLVRWAESGEIVYPSDVKRAVEDGLAAGWEPRSPGAEFVRGFSPSQSREYISAFYDWYYAENHMTSDQKNQVCVQFRDWLYLGEGAFSDLSSILHNPKL